MKAERVARNRNQRTELGNGKARLTTATHGGEELRGRIELRINAHTATRAGKPFDIAVTLTESELETALAALRRGAV